MNAECAPTTIKNDVIGWVRLQLNQVFVVPTIADPTTPSHTKMESSKNTGKKLGPTIGGHRTSRAKKSQIVEPQEQCASRLGPSIHQDDKRNESLVPHPRVRDTSAQLASRVLPETPQRKKRLRGQQQVVLSAAQEPTVESSNALQKRVGNNPYMPIPKTRPRKVAPALLSTPIALAQDDYDRIKREIDNLRAELKHAPTEFHARQLLNLHKALIKNSIANFRQKHVVNSHSAKMNGLYRQLVEALERCRWRKPAKGNSGSVMLGGLWGSGLRS